MKMLPEQEILFRNGARRPTGPTRLLLQHHVRLHGPHVHSASAADMVMAQAVKNPTSSLQYLFCRTCTIGAKWP
jgi:hypothetical protein